MTIEQPKITLVVPSYNQGLYLASSLQSIVDQRYPNLELFVMDGGSSDDSIEIIKTFGRHIAFWRSKPDGGQAAALAEAFTMGTGDLFGWLNSDDLLLPSSLEIYAHAYSNDPSRGVYIGDCLIIDKSGHINNVSTPRHVTYNTMLFGRFGLCQPASMFTRRAYVDAGGIVDHYKFSFDLDLYLKLLARYKAVCLSAVTACFRIHPASKTTQLEHVRIAESNTIRKSHRRYSVASRWGVHRPLYYYYRGTSLLLDVSARHMKRELRGNLSSSTVQDAFAQKTRELRRRD